MMKILGERKAAAARLAELIGERAVYTKMPRCAYEVGPFAIERDGAVTASESADLAKLRSLAQEGLLEGWEEPSEETVETTAEPATEAQDEPAEDATLGAMTISLPLTGHTANSLRNLVTMIYSRGSLISKATGGTFACTLEQVDALKDCLTVEDVITRLTPDLIGLSITPDAVTFTGFLLSEDPEKVQAFTQLAAQMNKLAKEQKRTQAKNVDTTNEKYIFRIWLLALGMGGDEFKTARRVLLAPLSGNAAFKDQAMEERWKEKQAAKRAYTTSVEEAATTE
ncbi:MAG: hypothetical protein IKH57_20030 [Clostridia bacterium]|nr:hypothetical protein [Clostridia bacterium]